MNKHLKLQLIIIVLISSIFSSRCEKTSTNPWNASYTIPGLYQYHGYNLDSTLAAEGTVDIILNDTIISGSRDIQAVDTISTQNIEVGIGDISGFMYRDSTFFIYLVSPELPTILLRGKFSDGLIKGHRILEVGAVWSPSTIGYYTLEK